MAIEYTTDLGLAKPDLYQDDKEISYGAGFDLLNRAVAGYLSIAIGDADYTLKDEAAARESRTLALKLTGTITTARKVKIPVTGSSYRGRLFVVWNSTTGGFSLTVETNATGSPTPTGIEITNGHCRLLWHDGRHVYALSPNLDPATGEPASQVSARVYHSANQSITNATYTALAFNSERWDTHAFHSTSTNTSRLTVPRSGLYAVAGTAEFASGGGNIRALTIRKNGSIFGTLQQTSPLGGGQVTTIHVTDLVSLDATDYLEMMVYQDSGGALNVNASTGAGSQYQYSPEFWITRLGPKP